MIKKITVCILLLLANFIIMAIVVMPHHHHRQLVCIESAHCTDDDIAHKYNTTEDSHRHDTDNNSGDCILKQVIVIPTNEEKQVLEIFNSTYNQSFSNLFNNGIIAYEALLPCFNHASDISQSSSSNSSYLCSSLGLRAPPSV